MKYKINQFYRMQFTNNGEEILKKNQDYHLKRSSSVQALLHGNPNQSNHYIDSLDRFKRDYASIDKQQRQQKFKRKSQAYLNRRNATIQRESQIKKIEEANVQRLSSIQQQSKQMHKIGLKKTAHTNSIPVNPINLEYQRNSKGMKLQQLDKQKMLNRLVRAHHIQNSGNSGYNIINGRPSTYVQQLVPDSVNRVFYEKLNKYYEQFQLNPNTQQK